MIAATGGLFALVLFAGVTALFLHRASDVEENPAGGPLPCLLGFFGIGELPVLLAVAIFSLAAGASGLVYAGLVQAVLGNDPPAWLPVMATCTAAGLGLGALRLATAANASAPSQKRSRFEKHP